MTRQILLKTAFSSGELDPRMFGRLDLRAHEDGARRLRNVIVHAAGGVSRRPGTQSVAEVPDARRLVAFDDWDAAFLLVLAPERVVVLRDAEQVADMPAPWTSQQLEEIDWVRFQDRIFIVHPDVRGVEIIRRRNGPGQLDTWELRNWQFEWIEPEPGVRRSLAPFVKIAPQDTALRVFRDGDNPPAGANAGEFVIVEARHTEGASINSVFFPEHYGVWLRVDGRHLRIVGYQAPDRVLAKTYDDFPNSDWTLHWEEEVFSPVRGWPRSVTFHQERLVIGGSRDLPDWVWMSHSGRPMNFDFGTGLDDEAIGFRLADDTHQAITSLVPGRTLQIFTTSGEWIVKGLPLTPGSVQVERQTRIGSKASPRIRPIDVDGATLFVSASGTELREFLYTEVEQAYQAADIATLSRHLLDDPIDAIFDSRRRLLWIVRRDGAAATVTIDRNSNVAAWSLQNMTGSVVAITELRGRIYMLVRLGDETLLDVLEDDFWVDHARAMVSSSPQVTWHGFQRYVGREVVVIADGAEVFRGHLANETLQLTEAASSVAVGFPYAHEIEPMPTANAARGASLSARHRPVQMVFRLAESRQLAVDTGDRTHLLHVSGSAGAPFSGDCKVRSMGWRSGQNAFLWRILDDAATSFTLLAAQTELKVTE